jgi:hypothetical protein
MSRYPIFVLSGVITELDLAKGYAANAINQMLVSLLVSL